jgi:predicted nucleic acid-binding protein
MSAVFADTFFWIAFTNIQDQAHEKAKAYARSTMPEMICTTEEVLTEYLSYFGGWGSTFRQKAALNVRNIRSSQAVEVVSQTADSFEAGFALYRARPDKGYSLTDCISMMICAAEG